MVQTIQREFRSRGAKTDRGIGKSLGHGFVIRGGEHRGTRWSCGLWVQSRFWFSTATNFDPQRALQSIAHVCLGVRQKSSGVEETWHHRRSTYVRQENSDRHGSRTGYWCGFGGGVPEAGL